MLAKLGFLLIGLGTAWGVAAADSRPILGLLKQGRNRQAVQLATRVLAVAPDDADVMAAEAVAWSRAGYHADALGAFALCQGSSVYEDIGIEAHADSLRAVGRGEEAAALRRQRLLQPDLSIGREIRIVLDVADDWRAAGMPGQALDATDEAAALAPYSPMVLAVTADTWLDLGDLDQADWYLARSLELGGTTRGDLVAGRRALIDGDVAEALRWAKDAERFRSGSPRLRSLEAEARRQAGLLDDALAALEGTRARLTEDPELLATRIRVLADLGRWDELEDSVSRARSVYGDNADVRATLAYVDARRSAGR